MKRKVIMILVAVMAFFSVATVNCSFVDSSSIVAYAATLSAPTVTVQSTSYSSAKVSWKKISSAKKYVVYRSTSKSSGYKAVKTITNNTTVSYTDTKLTCGKTYYYKVKAVNGNNSKTSTATSVKIVPATVTGLSISSTKCGYNTIKYSAVSGASGYQIYYSSTKNGTYKSLTTTTSKSYSHKIGVGKTGYYKVRAYRTVNGTKIYGSFTSVKGKTALNHSYGAYIVTKEATCATEGKKVATCEVCGAKDTVIIPADPVFYTHQYGDWKTTKKATCTETGEETKACKLCGKKQTRAIPKLDHDYGDYVVVVKPTCTVAGTEEKTCKNCGTVKSQVISALGHNWQETSVIDVQPTCTEYGKQSIHCTRCGETKDEVALSPTGHSFAGKGVAVTSGTHKLQCTKCGELSSQEYECNFELDSVQNATYFEEGAENYKCSYCGNGYSLTIPVITCTHSDSDKSIINTVESTCTKTGYTGDTYCSQCETVVAHGEPVAKISHNMQSVDVESTCVEMGYNGTKCTECDYLEITEYYPLNSHTKTTNYSFNDNGEFCYACDVCGALVATGSCTLNLNDIENINYEGVAVYSSDSNKLVLTGSNLVDSFDLEGDTTATITINATVDTDVKLCGVNITTTGVDCIKVNNKATKDEETGIRPSVDVSISVKDSTENTLKAITSGNAIDSEARLTLKGHGILNIETTSSSITCYAKMIIKNLTLNINSKNRGIDTKNSIPVLDENGEQKTVNGELEYTEEYYNIEIGANAVLNINSYDDGIRCKNLEFTAIDKESGDVDSILNIDSTSGDGIQIEGNNGITMYSGSIIVKAGKYAFNCKESLLNIQTDEAGNPLGTVEVDKNTTKFKEKKNS